MSKAELIRVSSRIEIYKKPIPIETIYKFLGIENIKYVEDNSVNLQLFYQASKNFWSFVDSNIIDYNNK